MRLQARARSAEGEDPLQSPPQSSDADIREVEAVKTALAQAQPLNTKSGLERQGFTCQIHCGHLDTSLQSPCCPALELQVQLAKLQVHLNRVGK